MDTATPPPDAVALSFIERINHGDVDGLAALMTLDHELRVFDEAPLRGREAVAEAWRGYVRAFPNYRIVAHRVGVTGDAVAILGHTTGSHLGLPDDEESVLTLIWVARVDGGRLASWTLLEDTAQNREKLGFGT